VEVTETVAFSGGVDSTALALLMPDARLVFTDTGWEFDHVYEHIDRFEQVTGRKVRKLKNEKFPDGIPQYIKERRFMPNHGARWCTRIFKIEQTERIPLNIAVRADEPATRGNTDFWHKYPLRDEGLTRLDCVEVCIQNDLLPKYPPYAVRGGCKGCFYKRKSEVIAMQMLVPEVVDELRELEESVQDERGRFFHMFPNAGMSIAEIQQQPPLFDFSEAYQQAGDTSDYGIACGLFCNR
jgi:hypothetical protein